jgi:hypothetical protein
MWPWIKTGICSIVAGIVLVLVVDIALSKIGDYDAIGAVANALFIGFPIGTILGAGLYRSISLRTSFRENILGGFLGFILSSLGVLTGLYAMDLLGGYIGFAIAVFLSAFGSVCGFAASSKILALTAKF